MRNPERNRRVATKLGKKFGQRVRSVRKDLGWSLEQLAERADMHVTYLSSVERGHRNPTLNVIGAIAHALGTTLAGLVMGLEGKE